MENQNSLFVTFALSLTAGLMFGYSLFVGYFNGHEVYQAELSQTERALEQEKLKSALLSYQIQDFQQSVANVLPTGKTLQKSKYAVQSFSQVVRVPANENIDLSGILFEKGKSEFNKHNYNQAIRYFSELIEKYPLSSHAIESRFLSAEGFFLKKDYRRTVEIIDQMVTLYPEHDLTGFVLLRMGQISELNSQNKEALEIYKAVEKNFSNKELRGQARRMASYMER